MVPNAAAPPSGRTDGHPCRGEAKTDRGRQTDRAIETDREIETGKIDLKRVILLEQTVMHLALNQGTFACSLGKFLSCQYDDVAYAIVVRSL